MRRPVRASLAGIIIGGLALLPMTTAPASRETERTTTFPEKEELAEAIRLPPETGEAEILRWLAREDALLAIADRVDGYVRRNAKEDFAGLYLADGTGGPTLRIGFARGLERHRASLRRLIDDAEGANDVEFFPARHSLGDLEELERAITGDIDEWRAEGIDITSVGAIPSINRVRIGVQQDPAQVHGSFEGRYPTSMIRLVQEEPFDLLMPSGYGP